ncbi:MAG: sn-glycerol-3-phosphate ABC transporter ATP-binding protein UgpC, partial [Candidatus Promineifilaceae bacterium]
MASVSYRHVYKRYGDVTVVTDLNMEIADKEFVVFVGPSGCGKSTNLRMLAGLEEISEGEILIGDRVVNDVPPKDRDIAMVFQSYALYPHMSVYDNMAFGLKLRKTPKAEIDKRVKEAADILGLAQLLDRKPKALSGGQRQRVAVGRAIVREPSVFLMDEPLSNLDAKLRVTARAEISKLHKRLGTTFIYVTHDQVEAMTMGDRIAVLSDGRLMQIDSPRNLYNTPANVFVAGFIGSPSMNFFDATLVGEEGHLYLDTGDFRVQVPDDRKNTFNSYVGKEVIFGMRPEHVHAP